jgi:hypothetical protein
LRMQWRGYTKTARLARTRMGSSSRESMQAIRKLTVAAVHWRLG